MMRIEGRRFWVCVAVGLLGCGEKPPRDAVEDKVAALSATTPSVIADTFVNSGDPNNNNGASPFLFTGLNGADGVMRSLIQFSMPPVQPGRTTVTSAQVTLTTLGLGPNNTTPPTAGTLFLSAAANAWGEGSGSGLSATTFVVGSPCQAGEATWSSPSCTGAAWSSPTTVLGSAFVPASINAAVTFTSNQNLVAAVQGWLDDPSTNHGFWIESSTESGPVGAAQRFYSREAGVSVPAMSFQIACKGEFEDTGTSCTTCTQAARASCRVADGNTCNDLGPPSTMYSCSCVAPFKLGAGGTSCVPGCQSNPCAASGDATATCSDTADGYTCTCSPGFISNGTSCVSGCGPPNPCGPNGTCTQAADHWSCACGPGLVSSGGTTPTCLDQNGCEQNHCGDGGDPGASCVDLPAPATGYRCTCSNGFSFDGTTCAALPPPPPTCDDQLATCQAGLATCQTSVASCQADLATSNAGLATSQSSLASCQGGLQTCQEGLQTCQGGLQTCQGGLASCQSDLSTCGTSLAASQAGLTSCQAGLATCQTDLASGTQSLQACTSDLAGCTSARDGEATALAACQGTSASLQAALNGCQAGLSSCQTLGLDTDMDGIPDRLDRCPGTPAGTAVDPSGCSQSQFCALVDANAPAGVALCLAVDWQNDEPIGPTFDCTVSVNRGSKTCVPNL